MWAAGWAADEIVTFLLAIPSFGASVVVDVVSFAVTAAIVKLFSRAS